MKQEWNDMLKKRWDYVMQTSFSVIPNKQFGSKSQYHLEQTCCWIEGQCIIWQENWGAVYGTTHMSVSFSTKKASFCCQVPTIEECEKSMHLLLKQRADNLVQRRQDDVKDLATGFLTAQSGNSSMASGCVVDV